MTFKSLKQNKKERRREGGAIHTTSNAGGKVKSLWWGGYLETCGDGCRFGRSRNAKNRGREKHKFSCKPQVRPKDLGQLKILERILCQKRAATNYLRRSNTISGVKRWTEEGHGGGLARTKMFGSDRPRNFNYHLLMGAKRSSNSSLPPGSNIQHRHWGGFALLHWAVPDPKK